MELKGCVMKVFCVLLLTALLSSALTEGRNRDQLCEKPSRRYSGFCDVIRCVNTCKGEGYTSGLCASVTAKCYCTKLCTDDEPETNNAAP